MQEGASTYPGGTYNHGEKPNTAGEFVSGTSKCFDSGVAHIMRGGPVIMAGGFSIRTLILNNYCKKMEGTVIIFQ